MSQTSWFVCGHGITLRCFSSGIHHVVATKSFNVSPGLKLTVSLFVLYSTVSLSATVTELFTPSSRVFFFFPLQPPIATLVVLHGVAVVLYPLFLCLLWIEDLWLYRRSAATMMMTIRA